jgi:hypothetical protein
LMDRLFGEVTTKVPLPAWIFEQAGNDEQEMKRLVSQYMKRYSHLRVVRINVKKQMAICIKK